MKDRLTSLYELQLIDDQIDHLEAERGDLPRTVKELHLKISQSESSILERTTELNDSKLKRETNIAEMEKFLENQKRYKTQLYSVKNNKEYDGLTKSIDQVEEEVKRRETENSQLLEREKIIAEEVEALQPQLDEMLAELKEKEAELKVIIKASEREEMKMREERASIEARVKKVDLAKYLHIRKAKGGKAVATIERRACSGCHYVIPSQRQLEIRRQDKLFTCESCGRFIVPAEIAESLVK